MSNHLLRLALPCALLLLSACRHTEGMEPGECADAADNDGDGLYDCDDPDCSGAPDCHAPEGDGAGECDDGIDNDGDGKEDCDDSDCAGHAVCGAVSPEGSQSGDCDDHADNDGDGRTDCDDPGCRDDPHCIEDTRNWHDSSPDDTHSWNPPDLEVDCVTYGYDSHEWFYEVRCIGWADAVTLFITQDATSPWEEEHELDNWDFDPSGYWDDWGLELPIVDTWQDQVDSVNTLFGNTISCPNPACENGMAWRMKAYEGATVKDCVVWAGADADVSLVMESGCREISFW
ncbi:MAG: hypothetical protein ABIO70_25565 [Pseudomonadota bacterium]